MGKINLNPGRPALDARHLDALCDLYLQETARRVEPVTLAGYTYALGVFRRWWALTGPRLGWLLTRQEIADFGGWLAQTVSRQSGQPLTPATRTVVLHRLAQVLKWGHQHDYIERDYSVWIPKAEGKAAKRTLLQVDMLAALLQSARASRHPARDLAILAVLISTGMRRAECCQLDVTDVHFDARGGGLIDIRNGKGGKQRPVVFDDIAGSYLAAHLTVMHHTTGPLWMGQRGNRLTVKGLYDVVKAAARRANLSEKLQGPHDLRRLFATVWNRNRKGLGYAKPLSLQLGHETAEMTLHYILQDVEDIRAVYVSPLTVLADGWVASEDDVRFSIGK